MTKRNLVSRALLSTALFSILMYAQDPMVDIDPKIHPHLAEAQRLVAQANHEVAEAQKDNHYDMKGHAEKARQLMAEVNRELKMGAEAANRH